MSTFAWFLAGLRMVGVVFLVQGLSTCLLLAQEQTPPSPPPSEPEKQEAPAGTSNDRLFFALPNFLTVENGQILPPLTTKQKYDVVVRTAFDAS
jgi:hypothetical protein